MEEVLYENSVYKIRLVPGKGYGMVAASKIPQGTRILAEVPLIRLTQDIDSKYHLRVSIAAKLDKFPPNYRKAYLELWNSYPDESKEVAIALTNALPLGPRSSTSGVFLQASRFNHSCLPNAQETWNENLKKLTIHACTDIEEGQEITITYLKKLAGRKARQQALQDNCRFKCLCSLCSSLTATQRKLSNERMEEIQKLNNEVTGTMAHQLNPLSNIHNIHRMLELMTNEGIRDVRLPRAYYRAFQTAISHGDLARARIFADRAFDSRRTVEGNDSPVVANLKRLTHHPYRHMDYRRDGKWKSNIEDSPGGSPAVGFEAWLWRREDKDRDLQFANLRCTETFPCFNDLPRKHEASTEFFEATDAFYCKPKKPWVFLGDILEVAEGEGGDLKVTAEDKNWQRVPVLIRTSEFDETFDRSMVKAERTIMIPFPVQDENMVEQPGIVVDKLNGFKILPMELEELLFLNDRVQFYSSLADGKTRCHGCKKESDSLQACRGCFFFKYCNESCQRNDHEPDCKRLQQPDFRDMFRANHNLEDYSRLAPGQPARECVVS